MPLVLVTFVTILVYAVLSHIVYVFWTSTFCHPILIVPVVIMSPYPVTIEPELNINPVVSIVGLYVAFVTTVPLPFHTFVPSPPAPIAASKS